jgi:hypothetical protein
VQLLLQPCHVANVGRQRQEELRKVRGKKNGRFARSVKAVFVGVKAVIVLARRQGRSPLALLFVKTNS